VFSAFSKVIPEWAKTLTLTVMICGMVKSVFHRSYLIPFMAPITAAGIMIRVGVNGIWKQVLSIIKEQQKAV